MLQMETSFPRCRATDSRWNKKPVSCLPWIISDGCDSCSIRSTADKTGSKSTASVSMSENYTICASVLTVLL